MPNKKLRARARFISATTRATTFPSTSGADQLLEQFCLRYNF
jgi:hypothetical protein